MKLSLSFIQAGALHGVIISFRFGLSCSACLVSGRMSVRSWEMEKLARLGSVWPAGMSS